MGGMGMGSTSVTVPVVCQLYPKEFDPKGLGAKHVLYVLLKYLRYAVVRWMV
jgi:hypothetical protein